MAKAKDKVTRSKTGWVERMNTLHDLAGCAVDGLYLARAKRWVEPDGFRVRVTVTVEKLGKRTAKAKGR